MVKILNSFLCVVVVSFFLLMSQPVMAMDLQTAKAQGLVGETASGYLEPVQAPTAEVAGLVADINARRRAQYEEIAGRNQTPLATVEQLAGAKAMEKSSPGSYVKSGGGWLKK